MYLGLDLGTSGLKAILVNDAGQVVRHHTSPLSVSRPHEGWSETDPADWIAATKSALLALGDLGTVKAIGLSGQMHGATCVDASGQVIRTSILWNDTRADKEAQALDANPISREITGNITFAGFTAPKILWMRTHEPKNYARIAKVLLPKDYLRFWLTGEYISEMSDASGTAWLDVGKREWSEDLLALSGLSLENMPSLVEGSAPSAKLAPKIAQEFGLSAEVVVAGGAGDNAATAMGLDIVKPKRAFISLGTSGVVFAANGQFSPDPASALHAFCHAVPATWHQMGVTLSATDSLNWLANQLEAKPAELVNELGALEAPTPEIFLPFLGGERTPYNSAKLSAEFKFLRHQSDRMALTRAVLDGVSFSLKTCLDLMEKSGGEVDTVLAVGGGAQSSYWLTQLATVLNRPVTRPEGAEHAAALGAARLGAMSNGTDFWIEPKSEIFEPVVSLVKTFEEKFLNYQKAVNLALSGL